MSEKNSFHASIISFLNFIFVSGMLSMARDFGGMNETKPVKSLYVGSLQSQLRMRKNSIR